MVYLLDVVWHYLLNLKKKNKVFVLLSDGECNEGSVWEALLFASANKLNNLIIIIDYNKWQATGRTSEILNLGNLRKKLESFGFQSREINGHNFNHINKSFKIKSQKTFGSYCAHYKRERCFIHGG